jgi:hypothetical protein
MTRRRGAPSVAPNVDERIHVHVRVTRVAEDDAGNVVRRERRRTPARNPRDGSGGTTPSSMNCIDLSDGSRTRAGSARRVTQLPQPLLLGVIETKRHTSGAAAPSCAARSRAAVSAPARQSAASISMSRTASCQAGIGSGAAFRRDIEELFGRAARTHSRCARRAASVPVTAASSDA